MTVSHNPPDRQPQESTPRTTAASVVPLPHRGILAAPVSLFEKAQHTDVVDNLPLGAVLQRIGQGYWRARIASVRQQQAHGKAAYTRAKDRLPAFTPCCALRTRDKDVPMAEKLISAVGLVHYDFDDVPDPAALKERLKAHPATVFAFTSTGGGGVKVGVAASGITDAASYKRSWHSALRQLRGTFQDLAVSEDPQVKFLHALCFVSDDPDIYMSPDAVPLAVPQATPDDEVPPLEEAAPTSTPFDLEAITKALGTISSYDNYGDWIAVGQALHSTAHPLARGLWDWWSGQSTKYQQAAQDAKWKSFTKDGGRTLGDLYTLAHQYGWRPAGWGQAAAAEASEQHNGITTFSPEDSLRGGPPRQIWPKRITTSTTLTTYPWPVISPEAFYGLAGDCVKAIEPHSESDPAALLGQFLVTAGVVMGRKRYFKVEATRHYTNLFALIVGFTARSRKGTSFEHIRVQMQEADPSWGYANHIKGVGSGEGLIYAVRDRRMGREAVKEKGRVIDYEEVELDPGVSDKRALFHTGEFSSILKVAAREGCLLSEIIRDAWDTGSLRNATKTSPLTASDAHIGIIGHITLDEVRKLLTSLEMANGFANRFLYVCAKRSKHLPDGGHIDQVDFRELRERLQKAIAFGKQEGQMRRDAQASAAWHAIYGMLSEDRTGLANTLLARAEAQVLRLSMLYALLDCTDTITHAHLNAALAVWEYAEDSATAVFGEATGDSTADTILTHLEEAGEKGLTQNYIVQEVFQRNLSAAEVTRALHLLVKQGRIVTKLPPSTSGPGRRSTVYTLSSYVENVVMRSRYLTASNDAVKSMGISTAGACENLRANSQTVPAEASEDAEVTDSRACSPEATAALVVEEDTKTTEAPADTVRPYERGVL
jgi:hypothetical protein